MINGTRQLFVEVTAQEVRFLYWEKGFGGKAAKVSFRCFPFQAEPEKGLVLRQILQQYRKNNIGRTKMPVYLLIPFQNGLVREFRLPWISKRERDAAIHYYFQHDVPVLADELVYDYRIIEEKEREYLKVRVTAARKAVVAAYAEDLKKAGYELRSVEYSVSALGEVIGLYGGNTVLCLQGVPENRILVILYKGGLPEVIREFSPDQYDIAKYHIYLGLQDDEAPVDLIITDGSVQAERAAALFQESGLAKKQQGSLPITRDLSGELPEEGFQTYSLLGEMLRVRDRHNLDFYKSFLRPLKVQTLQLLFGAFFLIILLGGGLFWYPRFSDYLQIQKQITSLRDSQDKLQGEEDPITWPYWNKTKNTSCTDLKRMQKALEQMTGDLSLTHLNYKQDTLYLWAECTENAAITKFIGVLTAEGWREPVLVDYKYQKQKISFGISVKR